MEYMPDLRTLYRLKRKKTVLILVLYDPSKFLSGCSCFKKNLFDTFYKFQTYCAVLSSHKNICEKSQDKKKL